MANDVGFKISQGNFRKKKTHKNSEVITLLIKN